MSVLHKQTVLLCLSSSSKLYICLSSSNKLYFSVCPPAKKLYICLSSSNKLYFSVCPPATNCTSLSSSNKLYNVREDPGEHDNLYGKPEYAEIQAELEQWLKEEQPKLVPFPKTMKKNPMGASKYYSGAVSPGWCCPNCA